MTSLVDSAYTPQHYVDSDQDIFPVRYAYRTCGTGSPTGGSRFRLHTCNAIRVEMLPEIVVDVQEPLALRAMRVNVEELLVALYDLRGGHSLRQS